MPDPPSGEENLRELRLKEADWIRADIEHERGLIERYYGFYLASLYFLIGWVVTSVIGQMSANQADAAVAELRKRPDMAIAISLIPALNTIFWVLLRGSSYRYVMLIFHLRQVGESLAPSGFTGPLWNWTMAVDAEPKTVLWNTALSLLVIMTTMGVSVGSLWVARPAVHVSTLVWCTWYAAFFMTIGLTLLLLKISADTIRAFKRYVW